MINIIKAVEEIKGVEASSVHPAPKKCLKEYRLWDRMPDGLKAVSLLGYLDMLRLMANVGKIPTDSGGIQKEAYVLGVPCITLRKNTDWVETLEGGWNVLVGADKRKIVEDIQSFYPSAKQKYIFGCAGASGRILSAIANIQTY